MVNVHVKGIWQNTTDILWVRVASEDRFALINKNSSCTYADIAGIKMCIHLVNYIKYVPMQI